MFLQWFGKRYLLYDAIQEETQMKKILGTIYLIILCSIYLAGCGSSKTDRNLQEDEVANESFSIPNEEAESAENDMPDETIDNADDLTENMEADEEETSTEEESSLEEPSPEEEPVSESADDENETESSQDTVDTSEEVRTDFKEFLDEYEEFMDEYCDFMKKYADSNNDPTMLADYMNIMVKYAEFSGKAAELEKEEMTEAEAKYYIEVTARVSKKLIEASY